ncbi:trypsin-like peptidase domain-containing protein [Actinomadura sp. 9N215]|uniref:trypsin-like peptidase domain-containing protein n=1 Tax=Actinomadura sp. 9N215 TaxID=3375150 RepID=UPI0037A497BB
MRRKLLRIAMVAAIAIAIAIGAAPGGPAVASPGGGDAPLLRSTDPGAERFRPVGRLKASSQCTATVISPPGKTGGVPDPAARALVLTAGHCVGRFAANDVRTGEDAPSGWTFTPAYFVDTADRHRSFPVASIRYATMKGVDLAVVELAASYADLAAIDVRPLETSAAPPPEGASIEVVHAPVDDLPSDQQFLRRSQCRSAARTDVAESPWVWYGASPNDCAGVAGGSSGGLVVQRDGRRVVAVLNTTVETSVSGVCKLGRPCEIGPGGPVLRPGTSYAIGVAPLAGCSLQDLSGPACRLDPGAGAAPSDTRVAVPSENARWDAALSANGQRYARIKTGPLGRTDCRDSAGYGKPFAIGDRPTITDPLPPREDFYLLCAVSGQDSAWVPTRFASFTTVQVDDTPPTVAPVVSARDLDTQWAVEPIFQIFEIVHYEIKYGAPDAVDCADPAGYQPYRRFPAFLDKTQAWRYCAIGYDLAGNATPPKTVDLTP